MYIKQNTYIDKWCKKFAVVGNSMDSEMSWLFDVRPRGMWSSKIAESEKESFFIVTDLKLDDFIKRKQEDLLMQRENQVKTTIKI